MRLRICTMTREGYNHGYQVLLQTRIYKISFTGNRLFRNLFTKKLYKQTLKWEKKLLRLIHHITDFYQRIQNTTTANEEKTSKVTLREAILRLMPFFLKYIDEVVSDL